MLTLIVPVFGTYGLKDVTPNRDGNRVIKVIKIVYPNDTFPVVECFECVETTFQLKGIRGIAEIERGKVIVINSSKYFQSKLLRSLISLAFSLLS